MLKTFLRKWDQFFFEERLASPLGLFRIALAVGFALHVFPSFIPLADNYLSTAFKEKSPAVFPARFLSWVDASPDALILMMIFILCAAWIFFLLGCRTQISAGCLLAASYYFYALNSRDLRTLAWDLLLLDLFILSLTPYAGDHFSLDAWLRKRNGEGGPPPRPIFIQRLLQLQLCGVYFYSALAKIWPGNWITENGLYYLLNAPPEWSVRNFWMRESLAASPAACLALAYLMIGFELALPFFLFWKKTRSLAIFFGISFHALLGLSLHIPILFLWLFPAQLALFRLPLKKGLDFQKREDMIPHRTVLTSKES